MAILWKSATGLYYLTWSFTLGPQNFLIARIRKLDVFHLHPRGAVQQTNPLKQKHETVVEFHKSWGKF